MAKKWLDPARWMFPAIGTYRLTKMKDNEGAYHLYSYQLGGWLFVRVEHEDEGDDNMTFLGEDDEYTYWR